VTAARWAERDLLEHLPAADIRVYAIWFAMYPGDARSKWPGALLTDTRVIHFWDEQRISGMQYLSHVPSLVGLRASGTLQPTADALWDAFFLYPSGATWQDPVPLPASWGYPIMATHDDLLQSVERLLADVK
jgi:hypothetical protein